MTWDRIGPDQSQQMQATNSQAENPGRSHSLLQVLPLHPRPWLHELHPAPGFRLPGSALTPFCWACGLSVVKLISSHVSVPTMPQWLCVCSCLLKICICVTYRTSVGAKGGHPKMGHKAWRLFWLQSIKTQEIWGKLFTSPSTACRYQRCLCT